MKAKVCRTGEIINVVPLDYYDATNDENYSDYELDILDYTGEDEWKDLRNQAAIVAMQGVMNFFGSIDYNKETIAKLAVEQANALIEELKK